MPSDLEIIESHIMMENPTRKSITIRWSDMTQKDQKKTMNLTKKQKKAEEDCESKANLTLWDKTAYEEKRDQLCKQWYILRWTSNLLYLFNSQCPYILIWEMELWWTCKCNPKCKPKSRKCKNSHQCKLTCSPALAVVVFL